MRLNILTVVGILACSGCSLELFDSKMNSNGGFVIDPYTNEAVTRNGPGFVVTIKRDLDRRLGVPDGKAFKEMLEKRLAEDRVRGNDYCPYGYEIVRVLRFTHYHTVVWVNCKNK
jgi:hypothetical protein